MSILVYHPALLPGLPRLFVPFMVPNITVFVSLSPFIRHTCPNRFCLITLFNVDFCPDLPVPLDFNYRFSYACCFTIYVYWVLSDAWWDSVHSLAVLPQRQWETVSLIITRSVCCFTVAEGSSRRNESVHWETTTKLYSWVITNPCCLSSCWL